MRGRGSKTFTATAGLAGSTRHRIRPPPDEMSTAKVFTLSSFAVLLRSQPSPKLRLLPHGVGRHASPVQHLKLETTMCNDKRSARYRAANDALTDVWRAGLIDRARMAEFHE